MNTAQIIWGKADDLPANIESDIPFNINAEPYKNNIYIILRTNNQIVELITLEKLEWDSQHFNKNIWYLTPYINNPNLEASIINYLLSSLEYICRYFSIDMLFCKVNTDMHAYIHGLEKTKFQLMDTLITFEHPFNRYQPFDVSDRYDFFCTHDNKHIEEIMKLAEHLYTTDRFHTDPNLDNEKCNQLYSNWIANQSKDPNCDIFVLKENETLVGFVTCKHHSDLTTSIQLVGVHPQHQGKGIGKELIKQTLNHYASKGNKITVGTQLINIGAIKCYLSVGFKISTTKHSFHRSF